MRKDDEIDAIKQRVQKQSGARALASPLYFIVQQAAVLLSVNLIFPAVLNVGWEGTLAEQAVFILAFAFAYILIGLVFLAIVAWLSIMFAVMKSYKRLKQETFDSQKVAREIALETISGDQPKWLISLAPPIVPMLTLALLSLVFSSQLTLIQSDLLMQACVLQGLISYVLTLPFILMAQRGLDEALAPEEEGGRSE